MTMRGVNPGRYRHRVSLIQPGEVQDPETGELTPAWPTVYTGVPCEVLTAPGREYREAAARQGETVLVVRLRSLSVLPTYRVVWQGLAYDIKSIELDPTARREMTLLCNGIGDTVGITADNVFLLESGDQLLLESGDNLLLE